jgi:hypothetical protein
MEKTIIKIYTKIGSNKHILNKGETEEYASKLSQAGFFGNLKVLLLGLVSEDTSNAIVQGKYKETNGGEKKLFALIEICMNRKDIIIRETWEVSKYSNQFLFGVKAYSKWNEEKDEQLIAMYEKEKSISQIAEYMERSHGAIRSRLKKLEII